MPSERLAIWGRQPTCGDGGDSDNDRETRARVPNGERGEGRHTRVAVNLQLGLAVFRDNEFGEELKVGGGSENKSASLIGMYDGWRGVALDSLLSPDGR